MDAKFERRWALPGSIVNAIRRFGKVSMMLTIVSLAACAPDPLDLDHLTIPETQIVVSSAILPDTSVAILLTKSIGALEANEDMDPRDLIADIAINDAEVTLTVNDSEYKLMLLQDGVYQGVGIPLSAGAACHLKVVSPKYGVVTASTFVQTPIFFDTVNAVPYMNEYNDYWAQVSYTIKDPPSENYYVLNVQEARRKDITEKILQPEAYTRQVDDKAFNAQEFSERFRAINKNVHPGDSIEVSLSNVSVDYFNYVTLRLENKMELVEIFSEPIYYPTNVRGGRGFFTLHLTDVRVIVL